MIRLDVRPYCHRCPKFDPELEQRFAYDLPFEQVVSCSNISKCALIEEHIRSELERKENNNE